MPTKSKTPLGMQSPAAPPCYATQRNAMKDCEISQFNE
jgi:hypothetical protein